MMRADCRLLLAFGAAHAQDAWLLSRLSLVLIGFCSALVRLMLMMHADFCAARLRLSFGAADVLDAPLLFQVTVALLGFC